MLDQIQTGKFIAKMRKDQSLTQKELAEKLGISDKTISKWETGRGLPEVSMMEPLCELLEINVNELLSGERLSEESYHRKAEKNMMDLAKRTEDEQREHAWTKGGAVVGLLSVLAAFIFIIAASGSERRDILRYLDSITFITVFGTSLLLLLVSGNIGNFARAFGIWYGRGEYAVSDVKKSLTALQLAMRGNLLSGVFIALVGLVAVLGNLDTPETLGPNVSVALLSILYGVMANLLLLPVEGSLKKVLLKDSFALSYRILLPYPSALLWAGAVFCYNGLEARVEKQKPVEES